MPLANGRETWVSDPNFESLYITRLPYSVALIYFLQLYPHALLKFLWLDPILLLSWSTLPANIMVSLF